MAILLSDHPHTARLAPRRSFRHAVASRLRGPGGLYNIGNAIALLSGLGVQLAQTPAADGPGAAVAAYLFGTPGTTWLNAAMLVFFASGEAYHRAWAGRTSPLAHLNRLGDLLSAVGAVCLTVALVHFGDVALAIVAGTLLAGGKLGTALLRDTSGRAARLFRSVVVASRLPSIAALTLELWRLAEGGGPAAEAFLPCVMLGCLLLWLRADLLLLRGA
jgi:hypothetical protein